MGAVRWWGQLGRWGCLTKTKVKLWKNANSPLAQQRGVGGARTTGQEQGVEEEPEAADILGRGSEYVCERGLD